MRGQAFLAVLLIAVGAVLIYAAVRGKGVLAAPATTTAQTGAAP